jgi:hypothetical protein
MLVCLSSGARNRYLEDIVRSLALPEGAELQFRYDQSLIHAQTMVRLKDGSAKGEKVLICYLFTTDKGADTSIVPTRFAEMAQVKIVGSSVVLVFKLGAFAAVEDYPGLTAKVRTISEIPTWQLKDGKLELSGCFVFTAKEGTAIAGPSADYATFEKIVARLVTFSDFQDATHEPRTWLFFHVMRLAQRAKPVLAVLGEDESQTKCPYKVTPGRGYALEVYHYFPNPNRFRGKFSREMNVSAAGDSIVFQAGKTIVVDTEYDIKAIPFSVKRSASDRETVISLGIARKDQPALSEISIPLDIRLNWLVVVLQIAIIGLGVMVPGLVGLWASGKEPSFVIAAFMFLGGCLAGAAATLGYKRGV